MRVAVIGAGIVGVSCALHLQRDGQDVTLLDPRAPGTATSFGNAGGIVTGAVVPNSTPALWRDIPRILFDRDSAVRVRWSYLPRIAPWLARFLLAGRHGRVNAIADALQPLVTHAYAAHRELIALAGAEDLVRPLGWLKVRLAQPSAFAADSSDPLGLEHAHTASTENHQALATAPSYHAPSSRPESTNSRS